MTKRFELIGKHKSTITSIDILSLKMGQVDVKPAVCVSFLTSMPNKDVLPMFSPKLLAFLYEKTGKGTGDLIAPVSDVPNLTAEAQALGSLSWEYEQTGCNLVVYEGNSKRTLRGGTVRKVKVDPKEGGTVDLSWQFYTSDNVDDEVIGHLGILKSLERDVELTLPEVIKQQRPLEEAPPDTPLDAAKRAHGKGDKTGPADTKTAKPDTSKEAANGPKKRRA
jgi:hypothetical protein